MSAPMTRMTAAIAALAALATSASVAIAAPGAEDIRDIRAPLAIPWPWRWPLAVGVAALAAFIVVMALEYWRRRRSRPSTPRERALEALRIAQMHARAGRSRDCADLLAATLRAALASRLAVAVLPETTGELVALSRVQARLAEDIDAHVAISLLETCDLARFARGRLDASALLQATELAHELVERLFAPPIHAGALPPRAAQGMP